MSADDTLSLLVPRLVTATYFEEAASAVLEALFARVDTALAESPYAETARLLRGVVHLRPDGTYQRLYGLDRATGDPVEGTGFLTSGTVWSWIEHHRCSVSIDVHRGAMRSWLRDGPSEQPALPAEGGLPGNETRERMIGRAATHVHVVPLRSPGNALAGMITLEASCKAAMGSTFVWESCHEELEALASIAGAFIGARALPTRPTGANVADEYLPVVGKATASLIGLLRAFAPRDDTVLISGPTGAGKTRLARWCHEHSSRKGQRFEVLDILAIPEDLQTAEVFGWKRGAFTGAMRDGQGAIARAAKGTLFLDEVDKLSMKVQAGLLRFIEERAYRMLGDDSAGDRHADVRLIVGTNADLRAAVRAGRFREDLYYRINVLPVRLPPLADRLDELPHWAEYMVNRRHGEAGGAGRVQFEPEAVKALAAAPWPGNLRQLDNIVRRAYALLLGGENEAGGDPVITRHLVERALAVDSEPEESTLLDLLWRAACAFVREADRRSGKESPLALDLADTFRGMVLAAAVKHTGSRDEAFSMLGQGVLLKNRNHYRALRRELTRVRDLAQSLGDPVDPELQAILEGALSVEDDRSY
ncbi:MAG TPA: sigma 54-interacting transcriptional regulator [Polyangiaceae bacterium]